MIKKLSSSHKYVLLPLMGWVLTAHYTHAQNLFGIPGIGDFMAEGAAWLSTMLLQLMSVWVALTGALLNVSITLTLHIKDFVDQTTGVYAVWQTIRDVSGIFIIFMLLYASFKLILGQEEGGLNSVGHLIKNIVIVGILINFSFFITSLLIDASNVVSLALYNGIVSTGTAQATQNNGVSISNITTQTLTNANQSGMADIFMKYLAPQSIYKSSSNDPAQAKGGVGKATEIVIQGVVGCIIMFTVGFSFLLASLAFVVRLILLILLLAFSPIWFASWVIPQLEDKAKEFTKQLKAQLIFMPVYLLLLYAGLEVLKSSSGTVFLDPGTSASITGATGVLSFIPINYIILAINDFFIIFLLNIPLVVAMSMGGIASDWIDTKKFGAEGMWKNVGGYAGTRSVGRLASSADKYLGNTRIGNQLWARDLRASTVGALAKNKMGGGRSFEDLGKAQGEVINKRREIDNKIEFDRIINNPASTRAEIGAVLKKMGDKEITGLGDKHLTDPKIIEHLKKSHFEAIKKMEEKDMSEGDKRKVSDARKKTFEDAIRNGNTETIKNMIKQYDGEGLLGLDSSLLSFASIVPHLNQGQLKSISDNSNNITLKQNIANSILNSAARGVPTPTEGYIIKNWREWGFQQQP